MRDRENGKLATGFCWSVEVNSRGFGCMQYEWVNGEWKHDSWWGKERGTCEREGEWRRKFEFFFLELINHKGRFKV
jgi:hypothetical protein